MAENRPKRAALSLALRNIHGYETPSENDTTSSSGENTSDSELENLIDPHTIDVDLEDNPNEIDIDVDVNHGLIDKNGHEWSKIPPVLGRRGAENVLKGMCYK